MKKKIAYIAFVVLLAAGCKKPDLEANLHVTSSLRTAGDYIQNNYAFSLFAYAVQQAGMMDSLNNANVNYTLLLPDNTAFNTDSIFQNSDLDAWGVDSLKFFVRNHLLPGKIFYDDVPTSLDNLYTNLNGISLYLSVSTTFQGLYIDGVTVKTKDIALVNGVIQVLTYPLKVSRGTVQDFLALRPDLQNLSAGLKRFGLWDSLRTISAVTVFAPQDTFFNAAGMNAAYITGLDTSAYNSVLFGGYTLLNHHLFVSDAAILVPAALPLPGGYLFDMEGGCEVMDSSRNVLGPLGVRVQPTLNDQQRLVPFLDGNHIDYVFANGVVHLIGNVLVLPADVPR